MKLKINKACDLSSISVLPPHSRRSNPVPVGTHAQLRPQLSQQSFSQGLSSQHGMFSQFSQSSLEDTVTNDQRFSSQERENSVKRISSLPPVSCTREESQMPISRSSNNLIRKWNAASADRCQVSEEFEHRIGMMETSLSRFGMILDSIQSDIMQVNKGTKEVLLETEGIRQKLIIHDHSMQQMNKGQEDIKSSLDQGLKSVSDQLRRDACQDKFEETFSLLSALPKQMEVSLLKLQNELCSTFNKEMQGLLGNLKTTNNKISTPDVLPPKGTGCHATPKRKSQPLKKKVVPPKVCLQASLTPNVEMGRWNSVKVEKATSADRSSKQEHKQKLVSSIEQERECSVIIESDEEIDGGFSCLLGEKETDTGNYSPEEEREDIERILRTARRQKRRHCNPIIIN